MAIVRRSGASVSATAKSWVFPVLLSGICLLLAFWATYSKRGDDAHITFVYSRNLADGLGFVFNIGDRTLSTTTPLMAVLMAGPSAIGLNVPVVAIVLSVLSIAGITFLIATNLRAVAGLGGVLVMLPVAILQPFFLTTITNELLPAIALALFALHQLARDRFIWAAAAATLCALMRPDGGLIVVMVGLGIVWSAWEESRSLGTARAVAGGIVQRVWRPYAIMLAISLPWVLFATWYFGSPVPVTLEAKRAQRDLGLGRSFTDLLLDRFRVFTEEARYLPVTLLAICGVAVIIVLLVKRGKHERSESLVDSPLGVEAKSLALFLVWNLAYTLSYLSLDVNSYSWYVAPLGVSVAILVGLGAGWIIQQVRLRSNSQGAANVATAAMIGLALLPMLSSATDWRNVPPNRTALYSDVGRWIAQNVPPDSSVATLEIGLIGYQAHREIIDFAGLLQPDVIIDAPSGAGYDGAALLAWNRYEPEFVAMLHPGIPTLLDDGRFQDECQIAATFTRPEIVEVMDIWDCRGLD